MSPAATSSCSPQLLGPIAPLCVVPALPASWSSQFLLPHPSCQPLPPWTPWFLQNLFSSHLSFLPASECSFPPIHMPQPVGAAPTGQGSRAQLFLPGVSDQPGGCCSPGKCHNPGPILPCGTLTRPPARSAGEVAGHPPGQGRVQLSHLLPAAGGRWRAAQGSVPGGSGGAGCEPGRAACGAPGGSSARRLTSVKHLLYVRPLLGDGISPSLPPSFCTSPLWPS